MAEPEQVNPPAPAPAPPPAPAETNTSDAGPHLVTTTLPNGFQVEKSHYTDSGSTTYWFSAESENLVPCKLAKPNSYGIGPFPSLVATAIAYDALLILTSLFNFAGNFIPLARCFVFLVGQSYQRLAPDHAGGVLLVATSAALASSMAAEIIVNGGLDDIPDITNLLAAQGTFTPVTVCVMESVVRDAIHAYKTDTWPDGVWRDFLNYGRRIFVSPTNAVMESANLPALPWCLRLANPSYPGVPYNVGWMEPKTLFGQKLLAELEVWNIQRAADNESGDDGTPYYLLQKCLNDNGVRCSWLHRLKRYMFHVVDALAIARTKGGNDSIINAQLIHLPNADYKPLQFLDGVKGTLYAEYLLAAAKSAAEEYNREGWPRLLLRKDEGYLPGDEPYVGGCFQGLSYLPDNGGVCKENERNGQPMQVRIKMKWRCCCNDNNGEGEERYGPFEASDGASAEQVHESMKQSFYVATQIPYLD